MNSLWGIKPERRVGEQSRVARFIWRLPRSSGLHHPAYNFDDDAITYMCISEWCAQRCISPFPLRFQCANLNGRQPLCNGREEARHFFPQIRDRLAIAREMPQQTSLEESIKQRIKGAPGDGRLSAAK